MAAGLFRWRGNGAGTKSAWADGRNWVNASGAAYLQARYPGSLTEDLDEVVFDAPLGVGALSPAGADMSAAEDLLSLTVGPDYDGSLASAGVPLEFRARAVNLQANSAKGIYLRGAATNVSGMDVRGGGAALEIGGAWGAPVRLFRAKNAIVKSSADLFGLSILYENTRSNDVILTIEAGAQVTTEGITQMGGIVTCLEPAALLTVGGGRFIMRGGGTLVTVEGGVLEWAAGNLDGNLAITGGRVDASTGATARTYRRVELFAGGSLDIDNGLRNITSDGDSSAGIFWYRGGTLVVPSGSKVTIA